jgi:hypothetical protein
MVNTDNLMILYDLDSATGGGLTDAELRATPVAVNGTVSTGLTQPLTDTQLRATAVPVSGTITSNIGTTGGLALETTQSGQSTLIGAVNETAPSTDTASSGLNGRMQRIAQRISSLIAQIPATLGQKTSANSLAVTIASDQSAIPITGTITASSGLGNKATYSVCTDVITGVTTVGETSLCYIFHANTNTKKVSIVSVTVDQIAGNGPAGSQTIELYRITAENATPAGTALTVQQFDTSDAASTVTARARATGNPTREALRLVSTYAHPRTDAQASLVGREGQFSILQKPYSINASTAGGYEVVQDVLTALTTAPQFIVTIVWTEE